MEFFDCFYCSLHVNVNRLAWWTLVTSLLSQIQKVPFTSTIRRGKIEKIGKGRSLWHGNEWISFSVWCNAICNVIHVYLRTYYLFVRIVIHNWIDGKWWQTIKALAFIPMTRIVISPNSRHRKMKNNALFSLSGRWRMVNMCVSATILFFPLSTVIRLLNAMFMSLSILSM